MSVHGEYSRALEALLTSVRRLEQNEERDWIAALENSRVGAHRDLSEAATACLVVLDSIDARRDLSSPAGIGPETNPLREPFQHLKAHCEAILGPPIAVSNPED